MSTADEQHEGVDGIPEVPAPAPNLTVAAVARRLGVAPPTLRTWDRRYGLGPSEHTAGAHRRYSPTDVARLMVMRRLTLQGVAPADAAKIALTASVSGSSVSMPSVTVPTVSMPSLSAVAELFGAEQADEQVAEPATSRPATQRQADTAEELREAEREQLLQRDDALDPFSDTDLTSARRATDLDDDDEDLSLLPWRDERDEQSDTAWLGVLRRTGARRGAGGGRVIAMPDGTPRSRGLARSAMSLDTQETYRILTESLRANGAVETWNELIMPVLRALGERTMATGDGIDVEHAFSEVVLAVLRGAVAFVPNPRNTAPVLLACADRDYHSLPLHALAAGLAERQVSTRMLGGGLPPAALAASVRRTGPSVVVLFARMPHADARGAEQLRRQRPAPAVVLAGPGWSPDSVPAFARQANSLEAAIQEVLLAVHA